MKRSLGALGLFVSAFFASGCPVYSDNVVYYECVYATDCPNGYRCSLDGRCVQAPPHTGNPGDGGISGDASVADGGSDARVDTSSDASSDAVRGDTSLPEASTDGLSTDAGPVVFCGNPNDCSSDETCGADGSCHRGSCATIPCINQFQCATTTSGPACVRGAAKGCGADRHCLTNERCVDGTCTAVTDLCSDRAQCAAGNVCVDGRCTASCTADGQCAPGFLCRTALGVCSAKAEACVHTSDCGSKDEVCVDGACVPRCGVVGACGTGANVCVDNGCVPSSKIVAECDGRGANGGCVAGSICLHQHCYATCAGDAGGCSGAAPVCKAVTVAGTSYAICGTTDTLGSECDATAGKACADNKLCIDGFCR
jgi:hypothetical protein